MDIIDENVENDQYNDKLNIVVNGNDEITQYAIIGGVGDDSIFVPYSIVPDDFRENYAKGYYLYRDGKITVNPDYKPVRD